MRGLNSVGTLALGSSGVPGELGCLGVKNGMPGTGALYVLFDMLTVSLSDPR